MFHANLASPQTTWSRNSASAPGVTLTVDIMGKITTQLSGERKTSNLVVAVNNSQGQQMLPIQHNAAQSGNSFSDSFRRQLPPGYQFGTVTATWDTTSVSAAFSVNFFTIGLTRFTQYNTPYHSQCTANPEPVLIIYKIDRTPPGYCYYEAAMLRSDFKDAVNQNGTGVLDMNGTNTVLKAYAAGAKTVCPPGTDPNHTFFSVDAGGNPITRVSGKNYKATLSDGTMTPSSLNQDNPLPGSVATDPTATDQGASSVYLFYDPVLLVDQNDNNDARGLRSVQDLCPGCSGQAIQGDTSAHIDMYNAVSNSCSARAVGDYGQYYSIRVR